jgi:hypothetical protein
MLMIEQLITHGAAVALAFCRGTPGRFGRLEGVRMFRPGKVPKHEPYPIAHAGSDFLQVRIRHSPAL